MSILNRFRLDSRTALVTGASQGIGAAVAVGLAEAGAHVILTARNIAGLEKTQESIKATGGSAECAILDVTDTASVDAMAEQFSDVSILVANSGIAMSGTAAENVTDKLFDEVFDVNLKGVFRCCRAFGSTMLKVGKGSIVVVGSISAQISNTPQNQSYYNASKAAVHHLTKSMAAEWAHRGVRINTIAPGYVITPMTSYGIDQDPEMAAKWQELTPMGRFGQPEEIASIALFLASEASSYMTGSVVVSDGGYTLW
jgi:NAD(P)-dependent dehydrogenase (short-subunit alcohol dehydrogenase family)